MLKSIITEHNGTKIEIIPLEYANSVLPENQIFVCGDVAKRRPIKFKIYLIKVENKNILIDAGCETMPGFDMKSFIGTVAALKNAGMAPDDITDVVITHSHHDHIECVKYFKKAVVHIQRGELAGAKGYIPQGFNVNCFDEEYTVSKSVRALKIGGHTPGSCIVEIKTDDGVYIIAGDECYLRECLEKEIPTGNSYCPQKSKEFIEKYSDKKYTVLLCHDD